ncbi:hypothetical protein L0U88_01975 [Flavihumibacter sp. RY-1]|uniref:DUF4890 domain-containing protein n=1 Tax=Flavihumibacter fluminis TaxID=2909236 RepID=A0ABS9BEA1_9BACT|nr:hypothetical protein [Flavihumibacter fluminis]MCF1713393.1 hypothetical protein [Flavihumibacter fluminis]
MKNILILSGTLLFLSISLDSSAQQKRRLSRAELQAKQANLPHKKPMMSKAEAEAIMAKRRMEARENKVKQERMKAELQQRERSVGNRE